MFRSVCSSSLRSASPLVRARVTPRTSLFARTVVTKHYTKDHELISYDSETKIGTVSITNHAQTQLGEVVFVEIPSVGTQVNREEPMGAVESVKAASDINAPVTGTVKEVNSEVDSNPGLINKSPENEGWLCKVEVSDPSELEQLLTEAAYKKYCEEGEDGK